MFAKEWEVGDEAWKLRQRLWIWEELLVECRNLLLSVML